MKKAFIKKVINEIFLGRVRTHARASYPYIRPVNVAEVLAG